MKIKCNADCKYVKDGYCTLEEIEIDYGGVGMPPSCLNFHDMSWQSWTDEDPNPEDEEDGTELRDDIPECLCIKWDCFHNDGTGICTLGYRDELYCERYVRTTLL